MKLKIVFFLSGCVALGACENDSESDLYSDTQSNQITYTNTVKDIITANCIMCHSQPPVGGAPMPLVDYDFVKSAVISRGLIERISSNDPGFLMPFGGSRLPQNKIDQIIAWKNANYPE